MATPAQTLEILIDQLVDGLIDTDTFLDNLDQFEIYIADFHERLLELVPPPDFTEGEQMQDRTANCFADFFDAVQILRDYVDTGDVNFIESARTLIRSAEEGICSL